MRDVRVVGSRAAGDPTPLSDWDFLVETDDFEALAPHLPSLIEPLGPLSSLWDPLSDDATYFMFVLPGPVKVDLVFDRPPQTQPPWVVTARSLPLVDAHFWDFTWWLASKRARGRHDILAFLLPNVMTAHILRPLGVPEVAETLEEAVALYLPARERAEARYGVRVPRALGDEVRRGLAGQAPTG